MNYPLRTVILTIFFSLLARCLTLTAQQSRANDWYNTKSKSANQAIVINSEQPASMLFLEQRNSNSSLQLGQQNFAPTSLPLYIDLELAFGEAIYSNVNLKLGIERIYGIIKFGFSSYESNLVYGYGVGLGTKVKFTDRHSLSFDLSGNQLIYDFDWGGDLNILSKVDLNYKFGVTDKFSLLIGPSYNVYFTREMVGNEFGTINVPYTTYENEMSNSKLSQWIGINAGISLQL